MEQSVATPEGLSISSEPQRSSPEVPAATLQRASVASPSASAPPASAAAFAKPISTFRPTPTATPRTPKDDSRDEEVDELGSPVLQPRSKSGSVSDVASKRGSSMDEARQIARSPPDVTVPSSASNFLGPSPPFRPHQKVIQTVQPQPSSHEFNFSGTNIRKSCDRCQIKHFKCVREAPGTIQTPCISCVQNGLAESCLIRSATTNSSSQRSRTPFGAAVVAQQQLALPTSQPPTLPPGSTAVVHHRSEPLENETSLASERSRISCDRCRSMKTKCVREPPGSLDVPCNSCIKRGLNACVIAFRFTPIAPGTVAPQNSATALPKAWPSGPPGFYPNGGAPTAPAFGAPPQSAAAQQHGHPLHRMSVSAVTDHGTHGYSKPVYASSSSSGTYVHPASSRPEHSPTESLKRKNSDASSDYPAPFFSGLSRLAEVAYKRPRQDTGPPPPQLMGVDLEGIPLSDLVGLAHRVTTELSVRSLGAQNKFPRHSAVDAYARATGVASGMVSAHGVPESPMASPQQPFHASLRPASPPSKHRLAAIDAIPLQLAISLLEIWEALAWPIVPLGLLKHDQVITLFQRLHSPQDHLSTFDVDRLAVACALLLSLHAAQLSSALQSQRGIAQGRVYKALFEAVTQRGHPLKSEDADPWLDAEWVAMRAHEVLAGDAEGRMGALKSFVKANLYAIDGTDEQALIKHISHAVIHAAHALVLDDTGSSSELGNYCSDEERSHDADWNTLWYEIVLFERSVPAINITGCGSFGMSINMNPSIGVSLSLVQEAQRIQDQRKRSFFDRDRDCDWKAGPLRGPIVAHPWLTSTANWILDGAETEWSPYARFASRCNLRMLTMENARLEVRMRLMRESLGDGADRELYSATNWRRFTSTLRETTLGSVTSDLVTLERMQPQATLFALRHAHHPVGEAWTLAAQAVLEQYLVRTCKRTFDPPRSASVYLTRIQDAASAVELLKRHTHAARARYVGRAIAHLDAASYVLQAVHAVASSPKGKADTDAIFLEHCLDMFVTLNESNVMERLLLGDLTLETPDVRSLRSNRAAAPLSPALPTQA